MNPIFELDTQRLIICLLSDVDADFILELLNEPAFKRYIGDRNVKNQDDARSYLVNGPFNSYKQNGFGLWKVILKTNGEVIGICGLVKRTSLPGIDIGYAFLERYWANGYATEAAGAVKEYARSKLNIKRLLAVVDPENPGSIRVLEKLGFRYVDLVKLVETGPELKLFAAE